MTKPAAVKVCQTVAATAATLDLSRGPGNLVMLRSIHGVRKIPTKHWRTPIFEGSTGEKCRFFLGPSKFPGLLPAVSFHDVSQVETLKTSSHLLRCSLERRFGWVGIARPDGF